MFVVPLLYLMLHQTVVHKLDTLTLQSDACLVVPQIQGTTNVPVAHLAPSQ